ncbi:MAG: TolC family protein [Lentimicrobiaceae bacterium]
MMSRIIQLLFMLTCFLLFEIAPSKAKAQEILTISLKEAQDYALINNASIRNSAIDLELAGKKIWETTAIGLPQADAKVNYQHLFKVPELTFGGDYFLATGLPAGIPLTSDDITNEAVYIDYRQGVPIPLGVKDNTTLDVTVSQLLFSGEYLVGLRASKVYYIMSKQAKTKTESDIRESVANTYSLALVLQSNLEVMSRSLQNLNKTLGEMREMNKQGFIDITDVDQVELTTLILDNSLTSLNRQALAALDLLKFEMGMPMAQDIVLTDSLQALAGDVSLEALTADGFRVADNINFQMLDTQLKFGKLIMQREKTTFMPTLAAVYVHTEKFKKIDFDFTPKDVFLLSLSIPLFSGGQRISKVQQRKLEYEKILISKDHVEQGLQLEYVNARNEVMSAFATYNNVKKNLELTQRIYAKTLIKYREGLSSGMDLMQAQNQYLAAQSEYFNNVYALLTSKNRLAKLTSKQ